VVIAPVALTAFQLRALSLLLNTPIYWAGPRRGYRYQFSRGEAGYIWIRYVTRQAPAGATDRRFRVVGTYAFPCAVDEVRYVGHGRAAAGPRGSIYFRVLRSRPAFLRNRVYIAFRGVPEEIEVFDPHPAVAAKLASTGRIRRVGG
jgi:hypothetical protein